MAANLTPRHLEIIQHALGLDRYGQGQMYRNYFCAGVDDEPLCRDLVEAGLMRVFRPNAPPYPYYNVSVTEAGKKYVRDNSPAPPKLTRGQKRYREWLDVADAFGGTFGEWLKWKGERHESRHRSILRPL